MDPHKKLSDALTKRLGLQISLSSLPVVEEWMDTKLNRWLESVPLPIEMGSGGDAFMNVAVSSDKQRLEWSAYGTPAGFIPKLAKYLEVCGATEADLARINTIGETFEPGYVGSWIRVRPGVVDSGWQFQHEFKVSAFLERVGSGAGSEAARQWLTDAGLEFCTNVSAVLDSQRTMLEVPLPGADWIDWVGKALSEFTTSDPTPLREFFENSAVVKPVLVLGFGTDAIDTVGVKFSGIKSDDLEALCRATELDYDQSVLTIGNAIGAERVEAIRFLSGPGGASFELRYVPGAKDMAAPGTPPPGAPTN